jgi:hypothetical protein
MTPGAIADGDEAAAGSGELEADIAGGDDGESLFIGGRDAAGQSEVAAQRLFEDIHAAGYCHGVPEVSKELCEGNSGGMRFCLQRDSTSGKRGGDEEQSERCLDWQQGATSVSQAGPVIEIPGHCVRGRGHEKWCHWRGCSRWRG